ncbi:hypothetical protein J5N97_003684 [Dioscorea zingiberensis]|uniref:ATP-dependent DNA helicase n=1 Tax=Dioscorea zingiberensis TaxID=325984 RepID=A0A9D5D721_9LILI|nr:hypothetical protein J5N97_003684 [Dioscorea zingiberensis]
MVRGHNLDNRWVVPYNPYLLKRYNCHINFEICSSITAVKYLYKYIYKGHDRVAINIRDEGSPSTVDEIKNFRDALWVSAPEAIWRIYSFKLSKIYPSVVPIHVHLPNKQLVTYCKNKDLRCLLDEDNLSHTMLTEFFKRNLYDNNARNMLYREFPENYVWDEKARHWHERKNKRAVGRVVAVSASEGERYYLRLLLSHVRGPTSFNDLLMVDGNSCSSFRDSAIKRGLIENDNAIFLCLQEATLYEMPFILRRLFATLLAFCEPVDVGLLWKTFFKPMSEDFLCHISLSQEECVSATLVDIKCFLESMGKTIDDYDLPSISFVVNSSQIPRDILEEMAIITPTEDVQSINSLNLEQKNAFEKIISSVNSAKHVAFFIDGPGGTGKTFLYRAILAHIRSRKDIAIATATSDVAASLLPGGRTAHSRFKIPLEVNHSSVCGIRKQSGLSQLIQLAKLIIWDEAPMSKRLAIEALDRTLQDIMENNLPFGGKVMVFGGDFRQVLPVVRKARRTQLVDACLVRSYLWPNMEKIILKENMRAKKDQDFCSFLLQIGDGVGSETEKNIIQIPKEMLVPYIEENLSKEMLINVIFPKLDELSEDPIYITERALLSTRNSYVDELNDTIINKFPGIAIVYHSFDNAVDENNTNYQSEILNAMTPNGLPPYKLILKNNCPVMLLRNLDPANGLCNGTRLICQSFQKNVIHAKITSGQYVGREVLLPRIPMFPAENDGFPFKFKRKQFPIRLSFAMTINKAQGQTIPYVGIYLPENVFSHGQLYVALSRGISKSTTKVLIKPNSECTIPGCTKNVVFREIYEDMN